MSLSGQIIPSQLGVRISFLSVRGAGSRMSSTLTGFLPIFPLQHPSSKSSLVGNLSCQTNQVPVECSCTSTSYSVMSWPATATSVGVDKPLLICKSVLFTRRINVGTVRFLLYSLTRGLKFCLQAHVNKSLLAPHGMMHSLKTSCLPVIFRSHVRTSCIIARPTIHTLTHPNQSPTPRS